MKNGSPNILTWVVLAATAGLALLVWILTADWGWTGGILAIGFLACFSPRQAKEWERGIVLRLGRFHRVVQPGIAWVIPGFDAVTAMVDMRIRATPFSAEKTLTKDTVPVNVDAVLFWVVTDAQKAILEVEGYTRTISWVAQTTLRDVIGKNELARMISEREELDEELQSIIDAKTSDWGITVQSVEIRDVIIPTELEDAMSRKAQADRERDARVILSESEIKVAEQMENASRVYRKNKTAMQLRAMNMTYESVKEKGALMVIPSDMPNSVNMGSVMGFASMGVERGSEA